MTRVGEIADTPGVHGVALAPDLGRGYVSAGAASTIVVFDLKTLARLKDIKSTGENPDAILYDAATRRVFAFNGRGRNATVIDAVSNEVVGTIALDAKPEFARADGQGHVYVNLEDKNSLAVIDSRALTLLSVWPIAGCEEPSGLALNAQGKQLFAACGNRVMAVIDASFRARTGHGPHRRRYRRRGLRPRRAAGIRLLRRRGADGGHAGVLRGRSRSRSPSRRSAAPAP